MGFLMKFKKLVLLIISLMLVVSCTKHIGPQGSEKWRAIHLLHYNTDTELEEIISILPELEKKGINVLIFEIDYHFEFQSHPELRQGEAQVTKEGARNFVAKCHQHGIRVIPEFQCVGHQSWAEETFPLLIKYPHFDLTPGAFEGNEGLYCREWDVTNPEVYKTVFALLDEIIDAFQADAFHVGMDEVFQLGKEESPATVGQDPGILYAKAINDIYDHLVKKRGLEMMMWSDRLFDGIKHEEFGEWEASINGTAKALDMIPKDIILCAWHYEKMDAYPSIPEFIAEGFRVLPTSWRNVEAAHALINYSYEKNHHQMLGHLFTSWSKTDWLEYPTVKGCIDLLDKLENE